MSFWFGRAVTYRLTLQLAHPSLSPTHFPSHPKKLRDEPDFEWSRTEWTARWVRFWSNLLRQRLHFRLWLWISPLRYVCTIEVILNSWMVDFVLWLCEQFCEFDFDSERSARSTFPELINFRIARLNNFRRVFGVIAPIFFEHDIAKPETKVVFLFLNWDFVLTVLFVLHSTLDTERFYELRSFRLFLFHYHSLISLLTKGTWLCVSNIRRFQVYLQSLVKEKLSSLRFSRLRNLR